MNRKRCFSAVCLFAGVMVPASAQTSTPDFHAFHQSVLLPYAGKVDWKHLDKTLQVRASVNGGPVNEFTVDTGSVGMIVSIDDVPDIDPRAPEGTITYNSSGVSLHGVWTKATVRFPDAKGGEAIAIVPVLAVSRRTCSGRGVNAARCEPSDHPHTAMLGIGFGRDAEPHPERNAFLNLRDMVAGTMRRGYVIAPDGITLGMTAQDAGDGFTWMKLTAVKAVSADALAYDPRLKDWEMAAGSFRVGSAESGAGKVLMDTGLTNMMIAVAGQQNHGEVPEGTPVTVHLLDGKVQYSFMVGDAKNPQTPRRVTWVTPTHGTYVNTGLRALAGYAYAFDDDGGWLGLRALKP